MQRTDEMIKKDIVDELFWDDRIDASKIEVYVKDGTVTVSGEVPTYHDLTVARAAVWGISGVIDVIDNLAVSYITPAPLPNDTEIQKRIQNIYEWSPVLDSKKMDISVSSGVVTLKGNVDSYWKKTFAEEKIAGLLGILWIDNKIAVVPTGDVMDETIARNIEAALERDARVNEEKVTVSVNDGIVTLTGNMPLWSARYAAQLDASCTEGVISVRNKLSPSV